METASHEVFISFSFKDQPMAEMIVNQLLNIYKISCWICTQDIRAGENYKRTIVKAINDSKILLLLQSENSMLSTEVPKEVSIALAKNKTVIPFVIDNSELSEDLEYDLITVQRIDARRPSLEDRIEELAKQICTTVGRPFEKLGAEPCETAETKHLISTASITPKRIFCGRDGVLDEIGNAFDSGENTVFLYGIGGIGKTQVAKQYAKKHKEKYDTVIFATYNTNLQDLIISDNLFVLYPELARYTMPDGSKEDNASYFKRKLEAIKRISNERTLIIIDNFDVEEDENLTALTEGRYHLLITTRCDFSRFYCTVKVEAITAMQNLKDIFMQNYGGDEVERDDPLLDELIELVNRHTYTVELLALHMENSGQTPKEMIEAIKKEGILSLNEQVRSSEMKTKIAYENLLKMFKMFSLSEDERTVLKYLSFMPIEGVNVRNFKEWAQLDSSKLIKGLENRSWITKNSEGIALHPIIREVVKHEIPTTPENCREFLSRFASTIEDKNSWHFRKSEKDRYSVIAKEVLARFNEITPETEDLYYNVQCLVSFAFDVEYALELAMRLYEFQIKSCGAESFKTARAAFKVGWMYANGTQSTEALITACEWLDRADKIFSKVKMTNSDEISRHTLTRTNLAESCLTLYRQTKDRSYYERGVEYANAALTQAEESFVPGDYHYAKIGASSLRIAMLLLEDSKFAEAIPYIDRARELFLSMFTENDTDFMICLWLKAKALYGLERYSEAIPLIERSAEGYAEFMGKFHPGTYQIYLLVGDCNKMLGNKERALDAYGTAIEIAEGIYVPDSEPIKAARERIKLLQAD